MHFFLLCQTRQFSYKQESKDEFCELLGVGTCICERFYGVVLHASTLIHFLIDLCLVLVAHNSYLIRVLMIFEWNLDEFI